MSIDGDVSWQRNAFEVLPGPIPKNFAFDYALSDDGKDVPCFGVFWIRSTPLTIKFWNQLEQMLLKSPQLRDQVNTTKIIIITINDK